MSKVTQLELVGVGLTHWCSLLGSLEYDAMNPSPFFLARMALLVGRGGAAAENLAYRSESLKSLGISTAALERGVEGEGKSELLKTTTGKIFRDKPIHFSLYKDSGEDQRGQFTPGHQQVSGGARSRPGTSGSGWWGGHHISFLDFMHLCLFIPYHLNGTFSCLQNMCPNCWLPFATLKPY